MPQNSEPAWTPFERVGEITAEPDVSLPDGTIYRRVEMRRCRRISL